MKIKSYFVLLKLEPFIGKMRQMWQSTNAFAVVQMTCDDMLFKLLHYWLIAPLLAYYKIIINVFLACIPMFLIRIYLDWSNDG